MNFPLPKPFEAEIHYSALVDEAGWIASLLLRGLPTYSGVSAEDRSGMRPLPENSELLLYRFLQENQLSEFERLLLAIGLLPHIVPFVLFDEYDQSGDSRGEREMIRAGLRKQSTSLFILPSGFTYLHIVEKLQLAKRGEAIYDLVHRNRLVKEGLITVLPVPPGEPYLSGILTLNPPYLQYFLAGITIDHNQIQSK